MKQKLDKIEQLIAELKQELEGANEHFLTYEEALEKADYVYQFNDEVFKYGKNGEWTLIKNGKVLKSGVDWCEWYAEGVFEYFKDGELKEVNLNNN
jgi:restriction endonuclease S subunit